MSEDLYLSPKEIETAKKLGISEALAKQRFYRYGWPKNKAITQPIRKKVNHNLQPYIDAAAVNGINKDTFYSRLKYGWSKEEACLPIQEERKENWYNRKYPKELLELAKQNGVKRSTFYARIYKGYSPEEAAQKEVRK